MEPSRLLREVRLLYDLLKCRRASLMGNDKPIDSVTSKLASRDICDAFAKVHGQYYRDTYSKVSKRRVGALCVTFAFRGRIRQREYTKPTANGTMLLIGFSVCFYLLFCVSGNFQRDLRAFLNSFVSRHILF